MSRTIDLRHFRYFIAVSEELNFGRAAARLFISQPPLSRQIHHLEEQLGVQLFVRTQSGVTLTKAGMAFLPEARRTLCQAEKAIVAAKAAQGVGCDKFTVGYTTVFDRSVIPNVLAPLQKCFPDSRIISKGKHSISIVRDIKNGTMDVGFIGLHTETKGLKVEVLHEEPIIVALPATHSLAHKCQIGFEDLSGELMFRFERRLNPGFYDYCQAFFEKIDFRPRTIPEPDDYHILLGLIAEGLGIAFIPASLQNVKRQGVIFRPLREKDSRLTSGIAVAYSDNNQSKILAQFLMLVRADIQDLTVV